jgi:hypothetical protein
MSGSEENFKRGKIVAPFKEGVTVMINVLMVALLITLIKSLLNGSIKAFVVNSLFYKILIGVVAITAGMSFGYSYLGAKIGRAKAGSVFTLIGLAVLIVGIYWMTHAFE